MSNPQRRPTPYGAGTSTAPDGAATGSTTILRRKILVVTDDAVGERMAGPAIRAWNIADVLSAEHDVRLASTRRATGSSERFEICDGRGERLRTVAAGRDILILQGFTLRSHPWLADLGARMVVDLYDPIHLEMLEGGQHNSPAEQTFMLSGGLDALRVQIENGDFFLCATERQRDLWLGHMSALGRVNFASYRQDVTLRKLIDIAPFGIPADPPPSGPGAIKGVIAGIDAGDQVLLWAGGVYNWFDPVTLIEAVDQLTDVLPRLRLVFMGTKHPSVADLSTVVLGQAIELATERGLLGKHVFFQPGWVPYNERSTFLTDADIGVSTHFLHVETAYSFRTRMLDYLWAGLPIVCSQGDEFAGLVARHGLGAAVPPTDSDALATALRELLTDPAALAAAGNAVRRLAPDYRWATVLAPLVAYCRDPWQAADGGSDERPAGRWGGLGARLDTRLDHLNIYRDPAARRRLFADGRWKIIARRLAAKAAGPVLRPLRTLLRRAPGRR